MPRAIQIKCNATGVTWTKSLVLAWLVSGWSFSAASAEESTLKLAPIRLSFEKSASLDYWLTHSRTDEEYLMRQTIGVGAGMGVRANSFLWYPWLVQVGAHVGVSAGLRLDDSSANSMRMVRSGRQFSRGVVGGADLEVVPYSRFPFKASFERSDARNEVGLKKVYSDTLEDRIRLSQTYRPRYGNYNISAHYDRSRSENIQAHIVNSETIETELMAQPFKNQRLQVVSVKGRHESTAIGLTTLDSSLVSRHTYLPSSSFSLATLASLTSTTYRQGGETGLETLQFSSAGVWRPEGGRLTTTGGVRLFKSSNTINGLSTVTDNYTGANIGASYELASWLRMYGSADAWDSNGTQTVSSASLGNFTYNLSLAAQHRTKPVRMGKFDYGTYVAANLSNNVSSSVAANTANTTAASSAAQSLTLKFQHGLSRSENLDNGRLAVSLRQELSTGAYRSLSGGSAGAGGSPVSFNHSVAWGWRGRSGTSVRISVGDSRTTGSTNYFQSFNLQGGQVEQLKGGAALSSNLTVNASRQGYDGNLTDSLTSTADMNYIKRRAFNTPRLNFRSTLRIISADLLKTSSINMGDSNQGQYVWENELTYTIGKLEAELMGKVEEVRASRGAIVALHVRRWF